MNSLIPAASVIVARLAAELAFGGILTVEGIAI